MRRLKRRCGIFWRCEIIVCYIVSILCLFSGYTLLTHPTHPTHPTNQSDLPNLPNYVPVPSCSGLFILVVIHLQLFHYPRTRLVQQTRLWSHRNAKGRPHVRPFLLHPFGRVHPTVFHGPTGTDKHRPRPSCAPLGRCVLGVSLEPRRSVPSTDTRCGTGHYTALPNVSTRPSNVPDTDE